MTETRRCPRCGETKPISEWRRNAGHKTTFQTYCKPCWSDYTKERYAKSDGAKKARRRNHLKQFGIEPETYDELLATQGGVCAICKDEPDPLLHVDHDHATGKVRGLLCGRCNRAIGLLLDDPVRVDSAAAYLRRHAS